LNCGLTTQYYVTPDPMIYKLPHYHRYHHHHHHQTQGIFYLC